MMKYRPTIAAMKGYEPGEQPPGNKLIKLNTNENPYRCSPAVNRAIHAVAEAGLSRYPDPFANSFRRRAADILGVDPAGILCGNGSDDLLTIITRTFVEPGMRIRMPLPSYTLYRSLAEIQGAECEMIPFEPDWTLPAHFAEPSPNVRLVFLPNPNSPSGSLLSIDAVRSLANALTCPLVVDEAYVDFADSNCLALVAENERVLVTRSLSKSYGLAGLRFGYVVGQPQVIAELAKVKDSYNCDSLSIAAATAAIDDQSWLQTNRESILRSRARLEKSLAELGFSVQPSQANFVWCQHSTQPCQPIYESLKRAGILIRYMNYDGWGDGLRITVGTDDQLDACLEHIKEYLATQE